MRVLCRGFVLSIFAALAAATTFAQGLTPAEPEAVGLSSDRLGTVELMMMDQMMALTYQAVID